MGTKISQLTAADAAAINADPTYFCVIVDGANRKVALTELVSSLGLGTAAGFDVGTGASNVVQLDGSAKLPAVDGSQLTGMPAGFSGAYDDLTGKPTLGTAAGLDVGTGASNVVQLDGSAKLPAVDGSQLTNAPNPFDQSLNSTNSPTFSTVTCTAVTTGQASLDDAGNLVARGGLQDSNGSWGSAGQVATSTGAGGAYGGWQWSDAAGGGSFSGAYSDLTGKPTLGTAAAMDVGTGASTVAQFDADGILQIASGGKINAPLFTLSTSGLSWTGGQFEVSADNCSIGGADIGLCHLLDRTLYSPAAAGWSCDGPFNAPTLKTNGVALPDFSDTGLTDGDYKLTLASGVWTLTPI